MEFNDKREWLETNGLGGFASSTVAGINTRRYHGLLMAATQPPAGRMLLLSKMEETLVIGDRRFDLSANCYPGAIHPRGFEYLCDYHPTPFPTFVYRVENVEIEKRVFMVHGENTTVIEYEVRGAGSDACRLEVRPLVAFRDYHSTTHRNEGANVGVDVVPGMASVKLYEGTPTLHFGHNADVIVAIGDWYLNFEFEVERERGLDYHEDLLSPFLARFELHDGVTATVVASMHERQAADAPSLRRSEIERRRQLTAGAQDPMMENLIRAADQFIVQRGSLQTVIAGYHWFCDWGRDTMVALPGLTLATGRYGIARDILQAFSEHIDQGMLPNRFPDAGETPEYNTVDATLWFFEAIRAYLQYTSDIVFVRDVLYSKLKDIVEWHLRGTRYGIRVDRDGLLLCGEPGVQLTWMDAKIGDWVVTPRAGKPVEIQALWYNALVILKELAADFGDCEVEVFAREMSYLAAASFKRLFWNDEEGCLYDVVDGEMRDGAIRPNQILAVSLKHSMLNAEMARQVVEVVRRELLTPAGLRTLSPRDSRYRGRYEGGVWERDSAYHQGTVWPWLMGPFVTAYLRVHGGDEEAHMQAERWLREVCSLMDRCGQLPEIANGDAPHHPRGCLAQAWSVAEILRAAVEDVYRPVPDRLVLSMTTVA